MATVAPPDQAAALGRDLRTVIALLTGERLGEATCATVVAEVLDGACARRHEATVYLLATHLLALDERPTLDTLAWTWLNARGDRTWSVRQAADALRLAVFAVESGWPAPLLRRLLTLITQSRATPLWIDLTDLARAGGRHAHALRPLLFRADPWRDDDPARVAALHALTSAHELHRLSTVTGTGFAVVGHRAPDVRCATLFTSSPAPSPAALHATRTLLAEHGLLHAVHASPDGVRRLPEVTPPGVLPLPATTDDALAAAARPWAARPGTAANLPPLLALPPDHILGVFPSGARLATEARWWAAGRRRRQAR